MYMILNPIPTPERLNALKVALEGILNMTEFFGFKFLTKEEATQEIIVHSKFAWCDNCKKIKGTTFEGFENDDVTGEYVGGDLVCQECESIVVTLYRPKNLLDQAVEAKQVETPAERIKRVLGFPKPAEELMLYDYREVPTGQAPDGAWEMIGEDSDMINTWRRPHECQTTKDVRCDVCGRVG
jgi:hypothetical protein